MSSHVNCIEKNGKMNIIEIVKEKSMGKRCNAKGTIYKVV